MVVRAAEVVTGDPSVGAGPLGIVHDGAVAIRDGRVAWVGAAAALPEGWASAETIRAPVAIPGLIDAHTHLIFAGHRAEEFARRAAGETYGQVAAAGGGIAATVRATRAASEDDLVSLGRGRLERALAGGITTVGVKSGYGLTVEDEFKILRAARRLAALQPVEIVPTLLAAHTVPGEYAGRRDDYVDLVVKEMIPRAAAEGLASSCDVFCEEGAFTVAEARRILVAGKEKGLTPRLHADQLTAGGGAELAAEVGAASADHLEHVSEAGIRALADAGVVGILLPGATLFLNAPWPPARRLIDAGVAVGLATDFNPGSSMTQSLPLMQSLACTRMGMTPAEALLACTRHAARSLGTEDRLGSLTPGKQADLVLLDAPTYLFLSYFVAAPWCRPSSRLAVSSSGRRPPIAHARKAIDFGLTPREVPP